MRHQFSFFGTESWNVLDSLRVEERPPSDVVDKLVHLWEGPKTRRYEVRWSIRLSGLSEEGRAELLRVVLVVDGCAIADSFRVLATGINQVFGGSHIIWAARTVSLRADPARLALGSSLSVLRFK